MNIKDMPILEGLFKYREEKTLRFHMPGHKGNDRRFDSLEWIRQGLYDFDNTEVPGLDNLHMPEEMIKRAQELAARAFGAHRSYFLVNGSTCGIYSMILGTTKPGDRILIQRNCHRSVFMAALLGDLETLYLDPDYLMEFAIPGGVDPGMVRQRLDECKDIKAIVLTNPSYYGICSDLSAIVKIAHARGVIVLVDEAHGAHFAFSNRLPETAMSAGADAAVSSIHKTLPALTQASILHTAGSLDDSGIPFMLRVFQTTSPSYILMASLDAARYIMETQGEQLLEKHWIAIEKFADQVKRLPGMSLLADDMIGRASIARTDWTKIVLRTTIPGGELSRVLREEFHIQVEMADRNNIVLITGVADEAGIFDRLAEVLRKLCMNYIPEKGNKQEHVKTLGNETQESYTASIPYEVAVNMREAYYSRKKRIRLAEAKGQISAEMVVPYPPGIPILLPGEYITESILERIQNDRQNGNRISGLQDSTLEWIEVLDSIH